MKSLRKYNDGEYYIKNQLIMDENTLRAREFYYESK